jgi:adenosylhomocysteine nucleosidase
MLCLCGSGDSIFTPLGAWHLKSNKMRILVTFAVDAEFAPWRNLRAFTKKNDGPAEYFAVKIGAADVNVLLTGVGGKRAWLETTKIVWGGDIDVCVSSGLAGALRSGYLVGDVLAAKKVHAISWKCMVSCEPRLIQLAEEHGARTVGSFYSSDRVVGLASEKRELGKVADAVEMESGEVLYEASAFGAKVIAVRGISDVADEDLPLDFNRVVTPDGEVSIPRVFGEVIRHPLSTPALVRFGKQSRMAAERLAVFLDHYVEAVVLSKSPIVGVAAQ